MNKTSRWRWKCLTNRKHTLKTIQDYLITPCLRRDLTPRGRTYPMCRILVQPRKKRADHRSTNVDLKQIGIQLLGWKPSSSRRQLMLWNKGQIGDKSKSTQSMKMIRKTTAITPMSANLSPWDPRSITTSKALNVQQTCRLLVYTVRTRKINTQISTKDRQHSLICRDMDLK